jgi:hypothetical protein
MNLLDLLPMAAIAVSGVAIVVQHRNRIRVWLAEKGGLRTRGLWNLVLDGIFIAWVLYFVSTGTIVPTALARREPPHSRPITISDSHQPAAAPEQPAYVPSADPPDLDESA